MKTGFPCVTESQRPNAFNAFSFYKRMTHLSNISEDDNEMTDIINDEKNASKTNNLSPRSNSSSFNYKPHLDSSGCNSCPSTENSMEIDEVREDSLKKYKNMTLLRGTIS